MRKKIIIFTIILLLLDQISKILVMNLLNFGDSIKIIPSFFYLTRVENDGAALNILSGNTILLITISLAALLYVLKLLKDLKIVKKIQLITYTLLLSGIIGNILDRIIYGKVIDFIDIYIFSYNFPVFNLADTFIVLGTILLGVSIIRGENNEN